MPASWRIPLGAGASYTTVRLDRDRDPFAPTVMKIPKVALSRSAASRAERTLVSLTTPAY